MRRRIQYVLAALALTLGSLAVAQEQKKPANPPPPSQPQMSNAPQKEQHKAQQPGGAQGELIEASREAAGEDENAQFKQSPSVRFVAHATGTTLVTAYWLCVGLNFAVVAVAILFAMKKFLPAAFRDRTATIKKALEDARTASEEANRRLGDIESRLARLDHEIAEMRTTAEQEGKTEEERIRAATEDERQKVVHTAQQEIAASARSARHELKAYVAELAVTLAEQKIQVGQNEDRELVRNFADGLGKDGR